MYISDTPNTGDTFSTATAIAGQMSYSSDGGDCLGLAQSTDTADCQGTWTVPTDLQPGRYTIMWWWEFNAGEFYNSCADVMITAAADGGGGGGGGDGGGSGGGGGGGGGGGPAGSSSNQSSGGGGGGAAGPVIGVLIAIAVVGGLVYWFTQVPCTLRHSFLALPTNLVEECGCLNRSGVAAMPAGAGQACRAGRPSPARRSAAGPAEPATRLGRGLGSQEWPEVLLQREHRPNTMAPALTRACAPVFEDASSVKRGFVSQRWFCRFGV